MANNSIYKICSEYISFAEANEKLVIQADWLADRVTEAADLSTMSREDLERRFIKAANAVCLYQRGYRSVLRGEGYFVRPDLTARREYLEKLVENVQDEELAKKLKKIGLQNILKALKENMDGQMAFGENGEYYIEPSVEDLLKMLAKDA